MAKTSLPEPTPQQLKFYQATQENRRQWVGLIFMFAMFAIAFGAFLVITFTLPEATVAQWFLGSIDLLFAWYMKRIYSTLFPSKGKPWWHVLFGGKSG